MSSEQTLIKMSSGHTLIIKRFPYQWSDDQKKDFMTYFGAIEVKCLSSKRKKTNTTFARFSNNNTAESVLQYLHQKEIFGVRLNVEFARDKDVPEEVWEKKPKLEEQEVSYSKEFEDFKLKLNSWMHTANFNLPPPVFLRYKYPEVSEKILTNICRALQKFPKFYTQVCHLMNKMNLPCPFVDEYPIEGDLVVVSSIPTVEPELSESESELEDDSAVEKFIVPLVRPPRKRKRLLPAKSNILDKASKSSKPVKTTEVFEVSEIQAKKIEVKVSSNLSSLAEVQKEDNVIEAKFETIEPPKKTVETMPESSEGAFSDKTITDEELAATRMTVREQRLLPVFKNYQPGVPSCRLYIKNLAKTVVEKDLHYIYRKFYTDIEGSQGLMFDVRLMQEGRMKGQAFVTLQSTEAAQQALKETNGFVLQGKPMVVVFARSAKAKIVDKPD